MLMFEHLFLEKTYLVDKSLKVSVDIVKSLLYIYNVKHIKTIFNKNYHLLDKEDKGELQVDV